MCAALKRRKGGQGERARTSSETQTQTKRATVERCGWRGCPRRSFRRHHLDHLPPERPLFAGLSGREREGGRHRTEPAASVQPTEPY